MRRKRKFAPAARTEPEVPDWVAETPRGTEYALVMTAENGEAVQDVILSRAEFIGLKQALAHQRGFA